MRCKGIRRWIVSAGAALMLASTWISARPLQLAIEHYPPYNLHNADGSISGMDVEVVQAAFSLAGIHTQIRYLPWKRAMKSTRRGRIDGLFSCVDSDARREYLLFSDPISETTMGVLTRADYTGQPIRRMADLKQLKVAVVNGFSTQQELDRLGYPTTPLDSIRSALNTLLYRDIDAYYGGLESALYIAHKTQVDNRLARRPLTDKPAIPLYLCLNKQNPDAEAAINAFNRGLHQLKSSGEYDRIRHHYGL